MKLLSSITTLFFLFTFTPQTHAQTPAEMICTPIYQFSQNETELECSVSTSSSDTFVVTEVNFPFHLTAVKEVTSPFSSGLSAKYPEGSISTATQTTIVTTSLSFGNANTPVSFTAAPIDGLSYRVMTDQSMKTVRSLVSSGKLKVEYISPNTLDPQSPIFVSTSIPITLRFDQSLILESFTQYQQPSIIQFLRLGAACYLKDPLTCVSNAIDNL